MKPRNPLVLEVIENGSCLEAANEVLEQICRDVCERPHLDQARTLNIKVSVKPKIESTKDGGQMVALNAPEIDWEVNQKIPGQKGMTTRAYVEGGQVIYNTGDPIGTNPAQQTFEDLEEN